MKKIFIVLILGLLFNSCATLPSLNIPQTYNTHSENGMIIGAIAIKNEKPIFNNYLFYYNKKGVDKTSVNKMIKINPEQMIKMKFKPDFFDGDKAVYYFSIQEPEGEYTFINFRLFENGGFIQSTLYVPIYINFDIEKGKVKYL